MTSQKYSAINKRKALRYSIVEVDGRSIKAYVVIMDLPIGVAHWISAFYLSPYYRHFQWWKSLWRHHKSKEISQKQISRNKTWKQNKDENTTKLDIKSDTKTKERKKDAYCHEVKFSHNLRMKQWFACLANLDSWWLGWEVNIKLTSMNAYFRRHLWIAFRKALNDIFHYSRTTHK